MNCLLTILLFVRLVSLDVFFAAVVEWLVAIVIGLHWGSIIILFGLVLDVVNHLRNLLLVHGDLL